MEKPWTGKNRENNLKPTQTVKCKRTITSLQLLTYVYVSNVVYQGLLAVKGSDENFQENQNSEKPC